MKIKNFRSFDENETVINLSKLTAFVGSNSSGKTALIQALLRLFGLNSSDRTLTRGDFHVTSNSVPNESKELELSVEVRIDFPELMEAGTEFRKKSIPPFFNQLVVKAPGEVPYLRVRLTGKWSPSSTPEGEIEQKLNFITVAEGEDEKDALIAVSPHQRSTIQMIYVPAIREPLSQLKNATGTILWRILNSINWPEDIDDQIKNKMDPVNELFSEIDGVGTIKKIVQEEWKKYHRDFRYQNASIEFNSSNLASILKKIEVQFSPTQETGAYTIDKLGDGLRSLFYLSLVSSLLEVERNIENASSSVYTILAVEEPENHISPHLLGRVMENLYEISARENAQVMLSSHSASIIKRLDPENIYHLRVNKENGSTITRRIHLPPKISDAYTYIKEAVKAYPEIYFARLVILGEGDSEEIVLPKLLEANDVFTDDEGISIVPLGGRHVNHMWKLLNQLEIPHITLLDLDRERGGGGWGRIKYVLEQLLMNGHDRNTLLGVNRGQVDGVLTEEELEKLSKTPLNTDTIKNMELWMKRLANKNYNVFFSEPLDLDFMMLEAFFEEYKKTVPRGPNFPDPIKQSEEYINKIKSGIIAALKNEKSTGNTYTDGQHELMVWYNTLFLGRSKPSTHIEALLKIDKDNLLLKCPQTLKDLVVRVKEILHL